MAARKRAPSKTDADAGPKQKPARKPTPLGTDTAITRLSAKGKPVVLTYWDVWFALVAVRDCDGDCDRLADRLKQGKGRLSSLDRGRPRGSGAICGTWKAASPLRG